MALLKNSLINFGYISKDRKNIPDFSESNFRKIKQLVDRTDKYWFSLIELSDNDTLERVAYEVYGSEDYWDILLLINNMDPLFDMAYDTNTTILFGEEKALKYINKFLTSRDIPESHVEYMTKEYTNEFTSKSEEYKTIKIIKPAFIQDFLKKINEEL